MRPSPTRSSPLLVLVLGVWTGATVFMFVAVSYSFMGIEDALSINASLRERVQTDTETSDARRLTTLHVYAGELNRMLFRDWNRMQLVLAAIALAFALARHPMRGVLLPLMLASVIVLVLTFYLAPELTTLGRELDFVARTLEEEKFERHDILHDVYKILEASKTLFLCVACFFALKPRAPADEAAA